MRAAIFRRHLPEEVRRQGVQYHAGGGRCHGVAAEGGAVVPLPQHAPALLVGQKAPKGQAPRDALGKGHHIRLHAELLVGKEAPGAADAGLHLVNEQQPVLLRAQLRHLLDKGLLQGTDAPLPLDEFHHHAAHVPTPLGLDAVDVVGAGIAEPLGKGEEKLVEVVLAGGLQGGDGAAMEGICQRNDGGAALAVLVKGVLPGQLDHALVGLGAGIPEEHAGHAAALHQLLRQLGIGRSIEQVGDMPHLHGLVIDGLGPGLIGVAQGAHTDAGGKVDILLPLGVPEGRALPVVDGNRVAAVSLQDILLVQGLDLFKIHGTPSFLLVAQVFHSPRR